MSYCQIVIENKTTVDTIGTDWACGVLDWVQIEVIRSAESMT